MQMPGPVERFGYNVLNSPRTEGKTPMEELVDIYGKDRVRTGEARPRKGLFLQEGEYMLYALALIENARGEFLITQRALDKSWGAGWWEVSGGGVLSGETPQQAIVREVAEETGLDVSRELLVPVYSYENVDLARGDNYLVDIFHFHMNVTPEAVTLQDSEAIDFKFASWADISALAEKGTFLHYERLRQALQAEGDNRASGRDE